MADGSAWLDDVASRVRCLTCGGGYERAALRVVGQRDGHWFVRCVCRACGSESVAAVRLSTTSLSVPCSTASSPVPLTHDDVLSVHEMLKDYTGDVHGLFGAGRSRERRG